MQIGALVIQDFAGPILAVFSRGCHRPDYPVESVKITKFTTTRKLTDKLCTTASQLML